MVHLLSAPAAAPPTLVQSANTQAGVAPWSVTLNPDGARMYVVNQGPANSNPTIEALWGIVGPTFGTPFGTSNNTIPLGTVIDGLRILFSPDGKRGYFGALGLFAGGADLRIYDTDPSSATLHQQITNRQWAGEFMFGFAVSPRGDMVATASAGLGLNSNIHLMDPAALISLPAVNPPLGRVVKELEFGPLGRHLFVLNGNEVRRVLVDQAAPPSQYGSSVAYTTGLPTSNTGVNDIELDDTGTRLYVSASNGVFEYDVATQALLRSWPTPTNRLAYR
jgi:DNA-binding beta-propeller fold protein YncE